MKATGSKSFDLKEICKLDKTRALLYLLVILILARFVYAAIHPVTGDPLVYALRAEFLAKEGRLATTEIDRVGGILHLSPMSSLIFAAFFRIGDLFGGGRVFMRMLPAVAGSLTIILVYLITMELTHKRKSALFAAIVFAALPPSVYFSTVLFVDMLLTFFVTLNIYLFILAMKNRSSAYWALSLVSLVFIVLIKVTSISILSTYLAFIIFLWRTKRDFRNVAYVTIFALIVFVAWYGYDYLVRDKLFLPYGMELNKHGVYGGVVPRTISLLKVFIYDFWSGISSPYGTLQRMLSQSFGGFAGILYPLIFAFWTSLTLLFSAAVLYTFIKTDVFFEKQISVFLDLFLLVYFAMFSITFSNLVDGMSPHPRHLLPLLPIASIYAAVGIERVASHQKTKRGQLAGILLVLLLLAQVGAGIALTAKRVGGWNECFGMVREKVPKDGIVFYLGTPDWIIYYTGLKTYGWGEKIKGIDYPYNYSLMYQLRTSDFLSYLRSYNVSYLYIDTGQSCGGNPANFYCKEFASSMETMPNAKKVGACNNPATGGWGVLYALADPA